MNNLLGSARAHYKKFVNSKFYFPTISAIALLLSVIAVVVTYNRATAPPVVVKASQSTYKYYVAYYAYLKPKHRQFAVSSTIETLNCYVGRGQTVNEKCFLKLIGAVQKEEHNPVVITSFLLLT
jgi:hypothetical protein